MEAGPRKILHTLNPFNEDNKMNLLRKYHNEDMISPRHQHALDKNQYDIQGYCKRMNDMMA